MTRLMILAVAATCAFGSAAAAKTVTYVETVTRADGTRVVTITKVKQPSEAVVTKASLKRSLLRSIQR